VQLLDFARQAGSHRRLGKLFARSLQLHPSSVQLWGLAARYEYEDKNNMQAARVLMQRALRFNSEDKKLWLEYAQLELLFTKKMLEKKHSDQTSSKIVAADANANGLDIASDVDQADESTNGPDDVGMTLDDVIALEKKEEPRNIPVVELSRLATTPVLQARIPRLVYESAMQAIPNDVTFHLAFLKLFQQFSGTDAAQQDVISE
jgi:U3 small nucleolar RNA-associated protein 6